MTTGKDIELVREYCQYVEGRAWAIEVILGMFLKGKTPIDEELAKEIGRKQWPMPPEKSIQGMEQAIQHVLHGRERKKNPGNIGYV